MKKPTNEIKKRIKFAFLPKRVTATGELIWWCNYRVTKRKWTGIQHVPDMKGPIPVYWWKSEKIEVLT